jgi:hypothetical protein
LHHQNQIKAAKEQLKQDDFKQISECFGEQLREFGRAVYSMRFDDEPNYVALQEIMKDFCGHTPLNAKYDWVSYFFGDYINNAVLGKRLQRCLERG